MLPWALCRHHLHNTHQVNVFATFSSKPRKKLLIKFSLLKMGLCKLFFAGLLFGQCLVRYSSQSYNSPLNPPWLLNRVSYLLTFAEGKHIYRDVIFNLVKMLMLTSLQLIPFLHVRYQYLVLFLSNNLLYYFNKLFARAPLISLTFLSKKLFMRPCKPEPPC